MLCFGYLAFGWFMFGFGYFRFCFAMDDYYNKDYTYKINRLYNIDRNAKVTQNWRLFISYDQRYKLNRQSALI